MAALQLIVSLMVPSESIKHTIKVNCLLDTVLQGVGAGNITMAVESSYVVHLSESGNGFFIILSRGGVLAYMVWVVVVASDWGFSLVRNGVLGGGTLEGVGALVARALVD